MSTLEEIRNDETIHHFILLKDLPFAKAGSIVFICGGERQYLCVSGLSNYDIPIEWVSDQSWFSPVSIRQYKKEFRRNCVKQIMEYKKVSIRHALNIFRGMFDK